MFDRYRYTDRASGPPGIPFIPVPADPIENGGFRTRYGTVEPSTWAERRARMRVRASYSRIEWDAFGCPVVVAPSLGFARVTFEEYLYERGIGSSPTRAVFIPLGAGEWRVEEKR